MRIKIHWIKAHIGHTVSEKAGDMAEDALNEEVGGKY